MYQTTIRVGKRSRELYEYFWQQPSRVEVLRAIYNSGGISRAEIARETGLTKVTVSEIVSRLGQFGLINESAPQRSSAVGKPPILVQIMRDSLRTIAIDASSTDSLTIGSVDLYGRVLSQKIIELNQMGGQSLIQALETAISAELAERDEVVVGIGIGVAGVVDSHGNVVDAAALGIRNLPLQKLLTEVFGIEVRVGNDANVATKADSLFGGGHSSHLLVRIGRGVGAGLILEGSSYLGVNFAAGELGHVVVVPGGVVCNCGKEGCLEAEIAQLLKSGTYSSETAGELLGRVIAPISSVLNLPEIVISCTFDASETLVQSIAQRIHDTTLIETSQSLVVRHSKLGEDIVLLGAAALALSAVLGVA